jgi:lipopolysaccharide transport system ATP-binding protein
MSNDIAIKVEGLCKLYRIGGLQAPYRTFRDSLMNAAASPFRKARDLLRGIHTGAAGLTETLWALKDVSFKVERGEVVGVIGLNGAGKSTLLKILSRITEPTKGYADIYGRVGSLLEVGTGFHHELTGRENIYLNGAILGMKKTEIERKFDEIVAFAELDKFIDTPVKHYSSGMYVRLAFAVAAHLEPEILLVDEVLAVGDAAFQKKCLGKMGEVAREGRTVLFVSHNLAAISKLCQRTVMLDSGELKMDGRADQVIEAYNSECEQFATSMEVLKNPELRRGDGRVRFIRAEVFNPEESNTISLSKPLTINLVYEAEQDLPDVKFYIYVLDELGNGIVFCSNHFSGETMPVKAGVGAVQCLIQKNPLSPGKYWINVDIYAAGLQCDYVEKIQTFAVTYGDFYGTGMIPDPRSGRVVIDYEWKNSFAQIDPNAKESRLGASRDTAVQIDPPEKYDDQPA